MSEEEIDKTRFEKIFRETFRIKSDEITQLKRKIEDTKIFKEELEEEEYTTLIEALDLQSEQLDTAASHAGEIIEKKLDESE